MSEQATFTLRLFKRGDPFQPLECRELLSGELAIGRDPKAGWALDDPDRALSRQHCTLALDCGRLMLRDTSTNGVYIGPERRRAPSQSPVEIEPGEAFRFANYMIAVEQTKPAPEERSFGAPASGHAGVLEDFEGRSSSAAPLSLIPRLRENQRPSAEQIQAIASLLDPFCTGAGLDPSSFLDEDPATVMHRAGSVYRQMVIGLTDLMNERTEFKSDYELDRTTVHASGNNPFRWASAECVGLDLLRPRTDGFLSGAAAVDSAFGDLKAHLASMLAGVKGALQSVLEALRPSVIETAVQKPSFLGAHRAAVWEAYKSAHGQLCEEAASDDDNAVNRGFRSAYQRQTSALSNARSRA